MESELLKFKHVLEYFVTHQNYLSSKLSVTVRGYDQYLKSFIEKNNFSMTGQGYNDGRIQNQIREWDNINSHQICLNIQPNFGNYESKKSYLNWRDTGLNIFCDWENSEVKALSIGYAYWWLKPTQYHIILTRTISELNLYEENGDNSLLKEFFDIFVNEINDYDNQKGYYYLKELEYYRQNEQEKNMEKNRFLIDIVVSNYNLILTGAPGTGKTYLAKQIAAQMILGKEFDGKSNEDKKKMNEQCGFVQFHPSYDYTDFVEGLRPIDDGAGNVSFRREDGIFMKFCRNALEAYSNAEDKETAPKYVFIIDEINRGELSKIFGELFFCIDPGYRGENGMVKTQYCNLWKDSDRFGGDYTFFIPKNVYIIGTMNDIDRSVESMDFAMRRRFAFKEIHASDTMEMIKSNDYLKEFYPLIEERMKNLNLCILTIQGFSSAYQIGAAYFLKLANYLEEEKLTEMAWENLWSNHLQGLLFEYLRGLPNADEELQKLYRAFLLEEKYKLNEGKVEKDE